jgi:hypothetical protein
MRNILVVLLFVSLTLCQAVSSFAKMYEEPRSFSLEDKSLQKVDRKVLKIPRACWPKTSSAAKTLVALVLFALRSPKRLLSTWRTPAVGSLCRTVASGACSSSHREP